jgi:hypothetical protein
MKLKNLRTLHLDANRVGYEGMKALANAPGLPALCELNLKYNLVDPEGLELMQESNRLNSLTVFKSDCPSED